MSRIGRMPITLPAGVEVSISGQDVAVKGPKGSLSLQVAEPIQVSQSEGVITIVRPDDERLSRSLHGLSSPLVIAIQFHSLLQKVLPSRLNLQLSFQSRALISS